MGKDSLARIAPSATAIGPPSPTARRLVNASVSANTPPCLRLRPRPLAAYLAALAVAAARFRARRAGQADPTDERGRGPARPLHVLQRHALIE